MSRPKQQNQFDYRNFLFSSQGEDSHNISAERSYNEIDACQDQFISKIQNDPEEIENQFFRINGPSVEFSQNYSQNSMMISNRQDDDSRQYRIENNNRSHRLLQQKKKEQILFNQALDQELNHVRNQLQKSKFQTSKLQSINKALQSKLSNKNEIISKLQAEIQIKEDQISKMRNQNADLLKNGQARDQYFKDYKKETTTLLKQLGRVEDQNKSLKKQISSLQAQIERLNTLVSGVIEPDNRLLDFRQGYNSKPYQSPINSKKNSLYEKEIQKLKKQKNNLQMDLSTLKDKLDDKENRFRLVQQENRKKLQLKEKKISQLQQKNAEMKDNELKLKTEKQILQQKMEKINNILNIKTKEISALNDKMIEFDKRTKSLLQESKKKDERAKQLNLQLIQKNRAMAEASKERQQTKIKSQFDHQMIEDKDKEIQRLIEQKKILKSQIQNNQKTDKNDKLEKNERERLKRQIQKLKKDSEGFKKQIEQLKKQNQNTEKQNEQLQNSIKQNKKRFDQLNKKFQQLRSTNTQLQDQIQKIQQNFNKQKQSYEKAMRQVTDYKKKNEVVSELRNKVILLESRLKIESQYRETGESVDSSFQDRIDALQHRLQERDKENKLLKTQLKSKAHCSDEEIGQLQQELAQKQQQIQKLMKLVQQMEQQMQAIKRDLAFKDQTLDFTHKILVKNEKDKIELQQQKIMLEDKLNQQKSKNNDSFDGTHEQLAQFYQHKIEELQMMMNARDKQNNFQVKQLKQRIRQLNDMLLNKERKITPQTMSQEDTVNFLIKTIKRVNRSADMLRILSRHPEFRQGMARMEKQFRK